MQNLLVIDDDPRIRDMLTRYFQEEGFGVTAVADASAMRACLARTTFDAILLDLVLPGGDDGLAIAREIRLTSDIPILMLTGRDDVIDRIVGLEIGADDYIAKPFHLREVLARLRTVLRRRAAISTPNGDAKDDTLAFETFTLDLGRRLAVTARGSDIDLTTGEFDMLVVLCRHPKRVFSRETLMELTRGRDLDALDRSIDAQICRLIKKLEPDPSRPDLIKSVRGVGYVFTGKPVSR